MKSKAELEADVIAAARRSLSKSVDSHTTRTDGCVTCELFDAVRALDAASKPHKAAVLAACEVGVPEELALDFWNGMQSTSRARIRRELALLLAAPDEPTGDA